MDKVLDKRRDGHNKMETYSETMLVLLRFQDQCTFKLKPRTYTDSDFDILYIDENKTTRPFQCHQSHLQIPPESSGIVETIQSPETVSVLRHHIGPLGLVMS
jgi:hypothetical protein